MQFHVEMTRDLIDRLARHGRRRIAGSARAARQSAADIRAGIASHLDALSAVADDIYARWARGLVR